MAERGITLSHEAVRYWCRKFGQTYANRLRRRCPRLGDTWHLDEVFLTIHGKRQYLWRAVDQGGQVLDILVQRRRDKQAAKTFFRKLLKGLTYVPRVIITDQLASDGAAKREILPSVEHRQHRYLNNRAENSHQPTRQRERTMRQLKLSVRPNASSQPTVASRHTSALEGIGSRPETIVWRWHIDVRSGERSPQQRLRPKSEHDGSLTSVPLGPAPKPLI
jgi:putative transposase